MRWPWGHAANSTRGGDFTTVGDGSRVTAYFAVYNATAPLATAPALHAAQEGVYPNPARGRFTLAVPAVTGATSVQAELRNALGQVGVLSGNGEYSTMRKMAKCADHCEPKTWHGGLPAKYSFLIEQVDFPDL